MPGVTSVSALLPPSALASGRKQNREDMIVGDNVSFVYILSSKAGGGVGRGNSYFMGLRNRRTTVHLHTNAAYIRVKGYIY